MKAGRLGLSFPFDSEQKSAPFVLLDQGYNFPKRYETSLLGSPMSGVQHAHTGDGCRHLRRSEPNARPWGRVTKNVPGSLWCVPTNSHTNVRKWACLSASPSTSSPIRPSANRSLSNLLQRAHPFPWPKRDEGQ